ncbi:MAG: AMP-binding protein, partial [Actinomycetota bacterium]
MTEPLNLATTLRAGYASASDLPALVPPSGDPWTYADLDSRAAEFAGALDELGIAAGQRLITTAGKSHDAIALYLACLARGIVYIPLNPAFTGDERRFFVDDARPALMVTDAGDEPTAGTRTETLDGAGGGTLAEAAAVARPSREVVDTDASDLAAMLYTSGTTGRPKGAMLTHRGLTRNAQALHEIWGFGPDDVLVHGLPVFHVHGLFVALHCAFLSGCEIRFLPRFSVDAVLKALPGASVLMGVPTHYGRLLDDPSFGVDTCASMRLFTSGSAPMTESMHHRFTRRTGHHILQIAPMPRET